jgi:hypothetical protein
MSAQAVRVSPDWLVLREPADADARSAALAARLRRHLAADAPLVVHDLGGGSGAMGRWLAPRLTGPQHWVVHDRDPELLALAVAAPPPSATVEARQADLAELTPGDLADASLVTASALLDLLTAHELTRLLRAGAGHPMLLALTVAGRVTLRPADPRDTDLGAAFNAHQRRHRLLGPGAVPAAIEHLRSTGAELHVRPSPWHLGATHADLLAEWLHGWVTAAGEQEPSLDADAYLAERLAQAAAGELAVTVDHADLLVLP